MRLTVFGTCVVQVEFLGKSVPRARHRKQLRFICRRADNSREVKVILRLSMKATWH